MAVKKYVGWNGRVVGTLKRGVFSKNVQRSKHLLRNLNAYGFDTQVVTDAIADGAKEFEVIEIETKTAYRVKADDLLRLGVHIEFGFGKQIALPLRYWQETNINQERLF